MSDCIHSMVRFLSEDGYDIYLIHSDLKEEDERELKRQLRETGVRLHFIMADSAMFEAFPEIGRYPRLIYYRIFAAYLLPQNLDRVLYLDGDTIIINSLETLYHMDFKGNYLYACSHVGKVLNKMNQYRLGMKEEVPYINSGVMLMNLEALRKYQNQREIFSYVESRKQFLTLPDQDIITALYGNKIGLLDTMVYNLSDRMLALYNSDLTHERIGMEWVRKNTVIIHYYGNKKPWKPHYLGILDVFYTELKQELDMEWKQKSFL